MNPRALLAGGLGPQGTRVVWTLGVLAAVRALGLVLLAEGLARGVAAIAAGGSPRLALPVALALVGGALRALVAWASRASAARAAIGTKERVRADLAARALAPGAAVGGGGAVLGAHELDGLDAYYTSVLPAVASALVVPVVVGARILVADWLSALIIVVTVPLVPLFMALVGMHTRERVEAASASLARLSAHLVELVRGLPVLVGLGRADEQAAALHRVSQENRERTLATLRTVFLSSLALELISTISVALVAVTIGIRLLAGDMPLETGLLVLLLAPECYGALREVGAAFHAAQDGVAALDRARALLELPEAEPVARRRGGLGFDDLTVRHADRATPAVEHVTARLPERGVTVIVGRTGSGKSTLLRALAGLLDTGAGVAIEGAVVRDADVVAWAPQHPVPLAASVRDELLLHGGPEASRASVDRVLAELGLSALADADPARVSPGELRRVAVARALVRVDGGVDLLVLDEPTAHLDARSRALVEAAILRGRGRAAIVLASHEPTTIALADARVELAGATAPAGAVAAAREPAPAPAAPAAAEDRPAGVRSSAVRAIARLLHGARARLAAGALLGALAALCASALTASSGWLIVRAAEHPPIMYLLVAIVGVRFFGLARSVLGYAERLVTHDAVFALVTGMRDRLWRGIAALGAGSRRLLRGAAAMDYLVVTADQVRDLMPRVLLPPAVGLLTSLAAAIATGLLWPPALPALAAGAACALVLAPLVATVADRAASAGELAAVRAVAERFTGIVLAADDLRGNGAGDRAREGLRELDARARVLSRRRALAEGLGGLVVVLACTATAAAMLVAGASGVAHGLPAPVAGVLALLPLTLVEPLTASAAALQHAPALAAAARRVAEIVDPLDAIGSDADGRDLAPGVRSLALDGLAARWTGQEGTVFDGVCARAARGRWLVVQGPSGSGKTTLLSVLMGALRPAAGRYLLDGVDAADLARAALRERVAWCPQEAHVFDSTLRANLLIARPAGDRPDEAAMCAVLDRVGLGRLVAGAAEGLDLPVGPGGSALSGGERQRLALARTLLTGADVLLLDEPTAHLDEPTADALMRDLRAALADRVVVLVTHRDADVRAEDVVLRLGGADAPARADSPGAPADAADRDRALAAA